MPWPFFISTRLHDEMVALLRAQIEELRDEKRRLTDVIFEQVNGKPLYALPLTPTVEPEPRQAQDEDINEQVKRELGPGAKARAFTSMLQKKVDSQYTSEMQRSSETARAVLKAAEERGRAAANSSAVN